jgi:hypothetical protein
LVSDTCSPAAPFRTRAPKGVCHLFDAGCDLAARGGCQTPTTRARDARADRVPRCASCSRAPRQTATSCRWFHSQAPLRRPGTPSRSRRPRATRITCRPPGSTRFPRESEPMCFRRRSWRAVRACATYRRPSAGRTRSSGASRRSRRPRRSTLSWGRQPPGGPG